MICYNCNHRVGTRWVEVCPLCGNKEMYRQNLDMRARIERIFSGEEPEQSLPEPPK